MLYGFRDRCRSTREWPARWLPQRCRRPSEFDYKMAGCSVLHWWLLQCSLVALPTAAGGFVTSVSSVSSVSPPPRLACWRAGVLVSLALALVGVVKPVAVVAVDEEARCREEDPKAGWPNTFIDFSTSCNAY